MKKLFSSLVALALIAVMVVALPPPAQAGVTWETKGQAKMGGLILNGVTLTSTGAELNAAHDQVASVSQVSTPATGSNGTQFTFKNAAGTAVTGIRSFTAYVSTSAGAQSTAASGLAVLTNGGLTQTVTGKVALVTTTAAGLLGVTLTASAGSYYLSFVLPSGKVITSTVLTVN